MKRMTEEPGSQTQGVLATTGAATMDVVSEPKTITSLPAIPRLDESTIHFDDQWQMLLEQPLVPGGVLKVLYDPRRLPRNRGSFEGRPAWDIVASALFHPSEELFNGSVADPLSSESSVPLRVPIPGGAEWVELWFANVQRPGLADWDSNFGQNYRFGIVRLPFQAVQYRNGAIPRLEMVNVLRDEAAVSFTGEKSRDAEVRLSLTTWVRNVAFEKHVWVDCHLYDEIKRLIRAQTLGLQYVGGAEGGGDAFGLDQVIHRGPRLSQQPGHLHYRLYYEVAGTIYTDELVHELPIH